MSSPPAGTVVVHRPRPVPDLRSAPYWEAAARHELALGRCSRCSSLAIPADDVCPHCYSTDPEFRYERVSGAGVLRSWTIVRQSFLPGLAGEVPFALVDVELDAQKELRMIGRLLDGPVAGLRPGRRVGLAFEDLTDGIALPAFTLTEDDA